MIIIVMILCYKQMIICTFLHRKNPHMPSKKGQITFFHFDFHFFSATSYLMRSHLACWVTSDENSAAIPLTHCSALLNVAVATRGLHYRICVCRGKKLYWHIISPTTPLRELPQWLSGKESICQCRRPKFDPWAGKIPWRRKWQPTPVFLPGKFHGQRSLAGYSPWNCKGAEHYLVTNTH